MTIVALRFGCAKQSKNLKRYLICKYVGSIALLTSRTGTTEGLGGWGYWEVVIEGYFREKVLFLLGPKSGGDNDTLACQWHPSVPPAL